MDMAKKNSKTDRTMKETTSKATNKVTDTTFANLESMKGSSEEALSTERALLPIRMEECIKDSGQMDS